MGKTKKKNSKEFGNLKGWEIQYLKRAKKYGHIKGE